MKQTLLSLIAIVIILTSCNKDSDEVSATGDVYYVAKKSGADIVYGLSIQAYAFYDFKSVKVVPEAASDKIYHLQAYPGFETDFYYDTPANEFSLIKPVAGKYSFEAVMDEGQTINMEDQLTDDVIAPPVLTKCEYITAQSYAVISWGALTGADVFVIRLYENSKLIFLVSAIDANTTSGISFNANSPGWAIDFTPNTGTTYQVIVNAFKYESVANSYDIQASSVTESTLLWGM